MILNRTPVTMAEVKEYTKDLESPQMADYLKAFTKTSKSDALKCIEDLKALNNHKIKEEHLIKIIDFMPKDSEDLNKIFLDVSLTEEESNSILEIIKKY